MKIPFPAILLACSLLGGCSASYKVNAPDQARKLLDGKNAALLFRDGTSCRADDLHIGTDSISYTLSGTDSVRTAALHDLASAKRRNHWSGAGQGTLIGAGTSFLFFSTLAAIDAEHEKNNPEPSGSADAIRGMVVMGGTLLGAMLGTLGGAAIGRSETYDVMIDSQAVTHAAPKAAAAPQAAAPAVWPKQPSSVRRIIHFGIDGSVFSSQAVNSFHEGRGFTISAATGVDLSKKQPGRFFLGLELAYTKSVDYLPRTIAAEYLSTLYVDRYTLDRMHKTSVVDLGILPTAVFPLKGPVDMGIYAGAAFGLGAERYATTQLSWDVVPASQFNGAVLRSDEIHGDHGSYLRTSAAGLMGASIYYRWMTLDFRYKSTRMTGGHEYHNFHLQAGIVF